jgi:hypothetical protein
MLKFDSWPPEQGKVHFADDAFDVVFKKFHDRPSALTTARSIAALLRDNCPEVVEAASIFGDLAAQLPPTSVTDATNGVDDIEYWHPREEFERAGHVVFEASLANVEGVTA